MILIFSYNHPFIFFKILNLEKTAGKERAPKSKAGSLTDVTIRPLRKTTG